MGNISLLDIVLLPKKVYQSLSENKVILYLGIILVGIRDCGFFLFDGRTALFLRKPLETLLFNIAFFTVFAVVIGLIDVLFFSLPLFDVFNKFFPKEGSVFGKNALLIKLMKTYILANLITVPIHAACVGLIANKSYFPNQIGLIESAALLLYFIGLVWYYAVIYRGVNVIYKFQPLFKRLALLAVVVWEYLLGLALTLIISKVVFLIFKV